MSPNAVPAYDTSSAMNSPTSTRVYSKRGWRELAKSAFVRTRSCKSQKKVHDNAAKNAETNGSSNIPDVQSLDPKDLTILQLLALSSLDLAAPASDFLSQNPLSSPSLPVPVPSAKESSSSSTPSSSPSPWVQCSGHEGAFAPAAPGTIWKKVSSGQDHEVNAYKQLMKDTMRDSVPTYFGDIEYKDDVFIEMEDLLQNFGSKPSIMDIKMGTRTFLESEASNSKPRSDLYEKMIKIDATAPTEAEHAARAITKLRYMQFRESLSSSCNLGFRIEGINSPNEKIQQVDFTTIKERQDTESIFEAFFSTNQQLRRKLVKKLKVLRNKFVQSEFFSRHEVIGSSLLIIHDGYQVGVWMIDFAKTVPLPAGINLDHLTPWSLGNHEDGYLFGLNNLIDVLEQL
ncbi:Inositol-trisphosphate 3-kinase A [Halotydeus destructor]|nr:Inositol-trisphosphate 3-kinase A [Halotydeus destructor]